MRVISDGPVVVQKTFSVDSALKFEGFEACTT